MPFPTALKQNITHWPVTGTDGYGGFTYGTPVEYPGRWEEKNELFLDTNDEEVVSKTIAYLNTDIDVGDYLAEGQHALVANPTSLSGAHRIRQRNKSTDLRNMQCLRKAFL